MQWILIGGILLMNSFPQLLLIELCFFAATTIFSLVTLPVECMTSNRALAWLRAKNAYARTHDGAKDALKWAARTYVVAALGLLLPYCIMFPFIWRR
jgi:Zn-dependent membrane protease YugP